MIAREAASWSSAQGRLVNGYREAPFFEELWGRFEAVLLEGHDRLIDLNVRLLETVFSLLQIEVIQLRESGERVVLVVHRGVQLEPVPERGEASGRPATPR